MRKRRSRVRDWACRSSRRLCELMGGTPTVESRPGYGSCFAFQIPAPLARGLRKASDAQEPAGDLEGRRVLLAEDGLDNQKLIGHVLRKASVELTIVGDGQAALGALESAAERGEPFDLVLMDMQMPVLDGYAAGRVLRAQGATVPVVARTAHAFDEERARCFEAGCNAFASKPIERRALLELIREWSTPRPR